MLRCAVTTSSVRFGNLSRTRLTNGKAAMADSLRLTLSRSFRFFFVSISMFLFKDFIECFLRPVASSLITDTEFCGRLMCLPTIVSDSSCYYVVPTSIRYFYPLNFLAIEFRWVSSSFTMVLLGFTEFRLCRASFSAAPIFIGQPKTTRIYDLLR